jgi:hypothetical protein
MFAIGHAATALVIKRAYPSVPMTPLLISVQAMEFAWVALNHLGIERPPALALRVATRQRWRMSTRGSPWSPQAETSLGRCERSLGPRASPT